MSYGRQLILGAAMFGCISLDATALEYDLGEFGISFTNRVSVGAAWRIEDQDPALIAKLNLDPGLCGGDDCISFTNDPTANQRLVDAPGAFFGHIGDDGDINYEKGDMVAAVGKLTTDLGISWRDFNLKARAISFYDDVNTDFEETHWNTNYQPNRTLRDDGVEELVGNEIAILDLVLSGFFYVGDRGLSVSVGQQKIRWGEANLIALNSINEINPPDARRLHQTGAQINEVFQPVPLAVISGDLFPDQGITAEAFYQLQWKPVIADPGGSFYGTIDPLYRSTDSAYRYALISLGQFSEDPLVEGEDRGAARFQNPLASLLTDTSFSVPVLKDDFAYPRDDGQFGVRLNWFADAINGGTEFGFYYMNYHSRLPYLGLFATDRTPLRGELATGSGIDALTSCQLVGNDCLPVDTLRVAIDYPEDIQMYGISFNTNIGKWSVAAEYSFRPNLPVQVAVADVVFAALQPALPKEDIVIGAQAVGDLVSSLGSNLPIPVANALLDSLGVAVSDLTNPVDQLLGVLGSGVNGNLPLDIDAGFPIIIPGARSGTPDFVQTRYRGVDIGDRTDNPYVKGYERLKVGQFSMTGIRVLGNSHWISSLIAAEQIVTLAEVGFTHIVDMPKLSEVQFNGGSPNQTHYSPGADGTGQGRHPDGPDVDRGARTLNPTSQSTAFATEFSWGYRILSFLEYNDVIFGLNFKPFWSWFHDVQGYAPTPMQNFLEGRREWQVGTEIFYGQKWALKLQYNGLGGTRHNPTRDRDNVLAEVSFTF